MGFLLLPLLIIIVVGIVVVTQQSNVRTAWTEAAERLGLQAAVGSLFSQSALSGRVRGTDVRVHTEVRRGGDNNNTFTVYTVHYYSDAPAVLLKREGVGSFFKRMIGRHDVQVGDAAFDQAVVVDSDDAAATVAFLTPARRRAILSLFESWSRAEVSNTRVMVTTRGFERNADRIVATVNRLVDTAAVLGAPAAVDRALALEADGDLTAGADELADINRSTDNLYTRVLEAQARMALGETERVEEILASVEPSLPADPEVTMLRRTVAIPTPPPIPPAAAPADSGSADSPSVDSGAVESAPADSAPAPITPSAPQPPERAADLSAEAVIADLFASSRMGHEVEQRFASAYRGAEVTWTGTVQRVVPYRSDRDFGTEPGTKVTVLIGHLGDGRLVTDRIDAILQLPADTAVAREQEITFTGTLARIDRYMRNVYATRCRLAR